VPDLRKDPITGRWVIIATDRARRPTDFARNTVEVKGQRFCPFCPGNELRTPPELLAFRTRGGANESGWTTRVIPAKFPALRVEGAPNRKAEGLYDKMNGTGAHEMIIESPEHDHTLASTCGATCGSATFCCSRTTARQQARHSSTRIRN
jgi:UDPglucose--hexose-1-phosphate uridylyltransferase